MTIEQFKELHPTKRYWIWNYKDTTGAWAMSGNYYDDNMKDTKGCSLYIDSERRKIESLYIDVEE